MLDRNVDCRRERSQREREREHSPLFEDGSGEAAGDKHLKITRGEKNKKRRRHRGFSFGLLSLFSTNDIIERRRLGQKRGDWGRISSFALAHSKAIRRDRRGESIGGGRVKIISWQMQFSSVQKE